MRTPDWAKGRRFNHRIHSTATCLAGLKRSRNQRVLQNDFATHHSAKHSFSCCFLSARFARLHQFVGFRKIRIIGKIIYGQNHFWTRILTTANKHEWTRTKDFYPQMDAEKRRFRKATCYLLEKWLCVHLRHLRKNVLPKKPPF